jgi:hypothetical protein
VECQYCGEGEKRVSVPYLSSPVVVGLPHPFIGQGEQFTIMPHSFSYVWRYGAQRRGVDGRPGESCF